MVQYGALGMNPKNVVLNRGLDANKYRTRQTRKRIKELIKMETKVAKSIRSMAKQST